LPYSFLVGCAPAEEDEMKKLLAAAIVTAASLGVASAFAQDKPGMTASLVDPEKNAAKATATVMVKVTGVTLTDPASVNEVPKAGQAHLHYQVDDGPVVATTSPKLSFHGLKAGDHTIVVMLAANDHSPIGPKESFNVKVTKSASH
jgi:hypothetical protein